MKKFIFTILSLLILFTFFSCASKQESGTAIGAGVGAGVGAILGQVIGGNTESTLIGAGIGGALGGVTGNQIGRYMDLQEQELRNAMAASEAASVRREQNILRATFKGDAYFDYNSSNLKSGAYAELQRISDILKKYSQTIIEVGGHTDTRGAEENNRILSLKRAESVKNELVQNGISPARIRVVGYGESRPISSDHAMNRRVEITIAPHRQ